VIRVYLDLCVIRRPLDTPSQVRIILEAEAVLGILSLCAAGLIELVSSEALVYEAEQNPLPIRREHSYSVLAKAKTIINVTASVKERERPNSCNMASTLSTQCIWLQRK